MSAPEPLSAALVGGRALRKGSAAEGSAIGGTGGRRALAGGEHGRSGDLDERRGDGVFARQLQWAGDDERVSGSTARRPPARGLENVMVGTAADVREGVAVARGTASTPIAGTANERSRTAETVRDHVLVIDGASALAAAAGEATTSPAEPASVPIADARDIDPVTAASAPLPGGASSATMPVEGEAVRSFGGVDTAATVVDGETVRAAGVESDSIALGSDAEARASEVSGTGVPPTAEETAEGEAFSVVEGADGVKRSSHTALLSGDETRVRDTASAQSASTAGPPPAVRTGSTVTPVPAAPPADATVAGAATAIEIEPASAAAAATVASHRHARAGRTTSPLVGTAGTNPSGAPVGSAADGGSLEAAVLSEDGSVLTRLTITKAQAAEAREMAMARPGAAEASAEAIGASRAVAGRLAGVDAAGGANLAAFADATSDGRLDSPSGTGTGSLAGVPGASVSSGAASMLPGLFAPRADSASTALLVAPGSVSLDAPRVAADELANSVRWTVGEGRGQALVNVTPAGLGPVAIRVSLEGDEISVSIMASQVATRDALESLVPRLRDQLAADGHASVEVDVSSGEERRGDAAPDGSSEQDERSGTGRAMEGRSGSGGATIAALDEHAAGAARRPVPDGDGRFLVDAWA